MDDKPTIPQQRARELLGGEIQIRPLEGLAAIQFPSGFSEAAARDYKALVRAGVSEKIPSKRYPKWKFNRTKPGCVVNNPDEEQALGSGWRDRPYTTEELAAPEEPATEAPQPAVDEVKEILHKSRGQLLQELFDFLFPHVCPIADSPEDAIRWIRTILIRSGGWIDSQPEAKIYEAISAPKTYRYADDGFTQVIVASLRPELVDGLNVAKCEVALEEVARRTAPPPSDTDRIVAAHERSNALQQELIDLLKRPPVVGPPQEAPRGDGVQVDDQATPAAAVPVTPVPQAPVSRQDSPPASTATAPAISRKKQATVTVDPGSLMTELKALDSNRKKPKKPLKLSDPSKLAAQLAADSPSGGPNKKTWMKLLAGEPVRSDVARHLEEFFVEHEHRLKDGIQYLKT